MERDRKWMYDMRDNEKYLREEYIRGVESFLEAAFSNPNVHSGGLIRCPCKDCENVYSHDKIKVGKHLMRKGFMADYYVWECHGEIRHPVVNRNVQDTSHSDDAVTDENTESFMDVVLDVFPPEIRDEYVNGGHNTSDGPEDPNINAREFFHLMNEANQPIYEGSDQTILEWCAEFLSYKTQHSISAAACDNLLKLSLNLLKPDERGKLPYGFDGLKKLMKGLGLVHTTYDVCENNDFLYYGSGSEFKKCPVCDKDRFKEKKSATGKEIAKKKLWYFPITPRLQRLFMCRKTAGHMTWHQNCEGESEKIIHPAGGKAWKHFNSKHPLFADDPRNVRLGLSTDGFNPYSQAATPYSCWPVFLTPYNLPPDLCMKDDSIFLSLVISGPQSPGMNIDVMLRPLIDELLSLWTDGAITYDCSREENFLMRAAIIWTISDFPAYGMLSGWSTHGRLACPYCMEKTKSFRLKYGRKPCWFDCHRQFLRLDHPARIDKKNFIKGRCEIGWCEERLSGDEIYNRIQHLPGVEWPSQVQQEIPGCGKDHNWKKKSIFWELPYWSTLLIRHNLDVMHIERNFFENIFRTVMDDLKTKDNVKSRLDLQRHTTRKKLFLVHRGNRKAMKPKASYTLSKDQRRHVCQWLKDMRFPDTHVSNIGRRVKDVGTGTVYSLKSHDCHVFMQRLLPIAFRDFLPDDIWGALVEVSNFFRALCAPEIIVEEMKILQKTIIETICKLETFFPPSFFDSMEHLAIHLPYEALVGGPVFYRWMYPFERKMFVLKSMVKNKARPEGSITEGNRNLEISNVCSHYYVREVDTRPKRLRRNEVLWSPDFPDQLSIFIPKGKPIGKQSTRGLSLREYNAAMLYILMNCEEADKYVSEFDTHYGVSMQEGQLDEFRTKNFVNWFRKRILESPTGDVDERLRTLAKGGRDLVTLYRGYMINGVRFHTEEGCNHLTTMNSGVCVRATSDSGDMNFYGMLQEVIEMSFADFGPVQKITLFKCIWYDNNKAVTQHPTYSLVDIDPQYKMNTDEVFILATQASQVYYAPYPSSQTHRRRRGKFAVCINRARHIINISTLNTTQSDAGKNQEYYQDDEPPQGSRVAADYSQYSVPNLDDDDGKVEVVDLPDNVGDDINVEESSQLENEEDDYEEEQFEEEYEETCRQDFEESDDEV